MKQLLLLLLVVFVSSCTVQDLNDNITDFESCVAAGNPVLETYPEQCKTEDGRTFTQVIDWSNDGVSLARVKETGELQCFGCGNALCVDPLLDAIEWVDETEEVHCTLDFEITGENTDDNVNPKYYENEKYCETDNDCTLRDNCCNSCYKDYVNIYNKEEIPDEECNVYCTLDCPSPDSFPEPVCLNNECTRVNSNQQLCENSNGVWGANACTNTCSYKRAVENGQEVGCGASFTPGCDCGANKCWDGNSCEDV